MALRHVRSDSSEWARFSRSPCTTSFLRWSSHALLWSAFIADLIFVLRVVIELVPKVIVQSEEGVSVHPPEINFSSVPLNVKKCVETENRC